MFEVPRTQVRLSGFNVVVVIFPILSPVRNDVAADANSARSPLEPFQSPSQKFPRWFGPVEPPGKTPFLFFFYVFFCRFSLRERHGALIFPLAVPLTPFC